MEKSQHSHLSIKHPKGWCWTNCSFTSIRKKQHFWCPTLFWLVVSLYHTYTLGFITSENFSGVYWSVITVGPIPGAAPLRLLGLPQKRRITITVNPREILGLMHCTVVPPSSITFMVFGRLRQNLFWQVRILSSEGFPRQKQIQRILWSSNRPIPINKYSIPNTKCQIPNTKCIMPGN